MSAELHRYRNTLTGLVNDMTEDAASTMPDYWERVADDAKPYEPGLFKPGKVGEFSNPEPLTEAEELAQREVELAAENSGPRSKAAEQAKADAKAAADAAAADLAAAQKDAAASGVGVIPSPEGGNQ